MKKILFSLVVLLFIPVIMKADPPKKVTLAYNEGKLKIVAEHPTKDSTSHYINKITIKVDGKEFKVVEVKSQSSASEEVIEVEMPDVKTGNEIEVKATCNKFGSKTAKIKIE
jgi:hypothetical protein